MGESQGSGTDAPAEVPRDSYSRREALHWAGGAAVAAALGPALLAAGCTSTSSSPSAEIDVAIVGGGPSGLYAAYRLLTGTPGSGSPVAKGSGKDGRPSVAVFEATGRLGGRIWSVVPPGAPHLIAEFGGMRFLTTQEIVPRLVKALRLPYVPFSQGDGQNLVYLRGARFRQSQYADPAVVPYPLPAGEAGRTPAELMLRAIDTYVPHAATLTAAQWEQAKKTATFGGQLLADQGFWNLAEQALGPEGFDLVADGVGYPSLVQNWNAAEQFQFLAGDFAPGAAYFTTTGGYQRVPLTLGTMARQAGAAIHLRSTVVRVAPSSGGGVSLTVQAPGGAVNTVTARHVIMTIPADPLAAVIERSPFLQDARLAAALATVGTAPASKMFLAFDEPWWSALGITGGYSITDLPIKRCWYFGDQGKQPGASAASKDSLIMLYNDLTQADYWGGYEPAAAFDGPPSPRTSPPAMVASAVSQLSELHGISVPDPYWSGFICWQNMPYGNAFHFWQVHARSWEVIPYLRQPFDGTGLSFCGDCWSPSQNWIESGLTTTEGLLQSTFRYRPPPWLPEGMGIST
jgi:lysine 2-monooxygenase